MRKLWTTHKGWGVGLAAFSVLVLALYAYAVVDALGVHSFTFDPNQTKLVSAEWMNGAGCPTGATVVPFGRPPFVFTDAACPTGDSTDNLNKGLVLVKTGPTRNFASADAFITGVNGITLTELGYDIRTGSHCGAGAPRFNVVTSDGVLHFVGCNTGTPGPSSDGWTRLRWSAAALAATGPIPPQTAFPPIPLGSTVKSIDIIFDEGQDLGPGCTDLGGKGCASAGFAVLDNIDINGTLKGKE